MPWRTHLLCWDCYTFALHELTTLMRVVDDSDDEDSDGDVSPMVSDVIVVNVNNNGDITSVERQPRFTSEDVNAVVDLTGLSDSEDDGSVATQ